MPSSLLKRVILGILLIYILALLEYLRRKPLLDRYLGGLGYIARLNPSIPILSTNFLYIIRHPRLSTILAAYLYLALALFLVLGVVL